MATGALQITERAGGLESKLMARIAPSPVAKDKKMIEDKRNNAEMNAGTTENVGGYTTSPL